MWNTWTLKLPALVQWFIASKAISVSPRSIASWVMRAVLHAVRPAPHDLAGAQRLEVVRQRLGQQDHVALGEQLLARAQAADERLEVVVGEAEASP